MQTHAGNGRRYHRNTQYRVMVTITSNRATVTVFVPCDLDL